MLDHLFGAQLQLPFVSERYTHFDQEPLQQGGLLLWGFNIRDELTLLSKYGVKACAQSNKKVLPVKLCLQKKKKKKEKKIDQRRS